jgi:predicted O-methyltransferase YrrM
VKTSKGPTLTPWERLGHGILRRLSPHHRARTDLFVEPYTSWVPWMSGLGDHGHVLYALVRALRPETVVEIGSARGRSTCICALGCMENGKGKVYAIDPHKQNDWTDVGTSAHTLPFLRERLRLYDLEAQCEVIAATSRDAATGWHRPIDLLFIDGDHTYEGVRQDFELFRPWLTPDALVCFHDSSWEHEGKWERFKGESWFREEMGVPQYLEELQAAGYESITLPETPGLTLLHPSPGGFKFRLHTAVADHISSAGV